jgi:hypothetical protein
MPPDPTATKSRLSTQQQITLDDALDWSRKIVRQLELAKVEQNIERAFQGYLNNADAYGIILSNRIGFLQKR